MYLCLYLDRYRQDASDAVWVLTAETLLLFLCQVGQTKATETQPRAFYSPEAIFDAVKQHLEKLKTRKEIVDYLTFVPDGEPTLDAGLVKSIELLRGLNYSGPQKTDKYGHHLYTAGTGFCIPGGNY